MVKMVMVVYNEVMDIEVSEILNQCAMQSYTKLAGVYGKGNVSGVHLGTDVWPGRNNVLYIACEEKDARQIVSCVKELRKKLGREGVKAFVWSLDEVT
ncbi:MAG: hypothetical protein A2Z72_06915 [Omnitrophica bacterium RBG_13_46_9]|nr:MAG: hypothetical protein A2Z72_06915 [Omnitrophica bacterium RBG_13_46_9]